MHEQAKAMKLPKTTTITAAQIDEVSFTRRLRQERELLLAKESNQRAKEALAGLSNSAVSLTTATTLKQVDDAVLARTEVQEDIRTFNRQRSLTKLKKTQQTRTGPAWAKLTSNVRDKAADAALAELVPCELGKACVDAATGYCDGCEDYEIAKIRPEGFKHPTHCIKTRPEIRYMGFIGDAGTGVGSRLKGHARRGGGKIREQHRQHGTVVMTNEFMTSKTCPFCFCRTKLARSRRLIDNQVKTVNVNGALECCNPACPAFKVGYTVRPRDGQAAVNIAIAGFSALGQDMEDKAKIGEPIAPFRSYLRPHEHQRHFAGSSTRIQHLHEDAMDAP
jgi:hypothetical protein